MKNKRLTNFDHKKETFWYKKAEFWYKKAKFWYKKQNIDKNWLFFWQVEQNYA